MLSMALFLMMSEAQSTLHSLLPSLPGSEIVKYMTDWKQHFNQLDGVGPVDNRPSTD